MSEVRALTTASPNASGAARLVCAGPPSAAARFRAQLAAEHGDALDWRRETITLYDAPDGALAAAGCAVELREAGESRRLTAWRDAAGGPSGVHHGALAANASVDVAAFAARVDDAVFARAFGATDGRLRPRAVAAADVWTRIVRRGRSVVAVRLEQPLDERGGLATIAFDSVDGPADAAFDLAAEAAAHGGLRPAADGLVARLFAARSDGPPRARIEREDTAADALAQGLAASARRVIDLAPLLAAARDPERARQMRVALRRFRAYERVFRKGLRTDGLRELARTAQGFGRLIGAARDWDVFIGDSLPLVESRANSSLGAARLRALCEARRADAWDEVVATVDGPAFAAFSLALLRAARLQEWRADARERLTRPCAEFAPAALDRRFDAARLAGETAMDGDPQALHDLRIEIKKLRYAMQIFRDVLDRKSRKALNARLAALQDALGAVNDAATADALARAAAAPAVAAERAPALVGRALLGAARAAGFVSGYRGAEADLAVADALPAWREIAEEPPFWRADAGADARAAE
ncbi:MAG: CHAD domain-containing protein [Parvularculaceae bacterium]